MDGTLISQETAQSARTDTDTQRDCRGILSSYTDVSVCLSVRLSDYVHRSLSSGPDLAGGGPGAQLAWGPLSGRL